jgi:hypothetical protein
MNNIVRAVPSVLVFIIILGLFARSGNSMPNNAEIFLNENAKIYLSPPCLLGGDFINSDKFTSEEQIKSQFTLTNFDNIRKLNGQRGLEEKIHPDKICNNNQGYGEDMTLIESVVIGHPIFSGKRWNEDGSWNW